MLTIRNIENFILFCLERNGPLNLSYLKQYILITNPKIRNLTSAGGGGANAYSVYFTKYSDKPYEIRKKMDVIRQCYAYTDKFDRRLISENLNNDILH